MYGQRAKSKALKRRVIIKRVRRVVPPRPHGAWKIAYADFVTALMAFFLLMWLTSTISHKDLLAISEYFKTPLITLFGGQSQDDINSVIVSSYGDDKSKDSGQVSNGTQAPKPIPLTEADTRKLVHLQELERLQQLKRQLEELIDTDPKLNKFKNQLLIDLTTEGLRILIIDAQNRPMFELGSSTLQPYTVEILRAIGNVLNQVPNKIGLSGHTDAAPYQGGSTGYSNWELSADRANASRRELSEGGMDSAKVLRVVGLAASALFNPRNPYDASNRRISILVMNRKAEEQVTGDGEQ
jgi:chemotaxis protein MotB